uniref:DUF4939 domain-containing protein n=1 Tax=Seriola dumerili TaxID=41447 RepID=A0A3B4V0N9_SERDU
MINYCEVLLNVLRRHISVCLCSYLTAAPAPLPREPHIPTPERYSGELGTCARFLLQCSLVFSEQPTTYVSDEAKIAFLVSLLTGRATQWCCLSARLDDPHLLAKETNFTP